ncbi:MAG TPA: type II toxin-antitoxin system VapC family toxin [Thermomicrobiales bacterium]|nr:type II toxin-antitoxin system VapC family toxin [Thermomicrobiales bacterium]
MRPWVAGHEAATSLLVYAEVTEYVRGRPDAEAYQRALRALLREVRPYAPTYAILERYADPRRRMRPPHGPGLIGDIDTLIAATALTRDLTVVSTNSDYRRVPGLSLLLLTRAQLV